MKVIITEKPSVARDIARVLKIKTAKTGYYEGNGYQITWAFGHLIEMLHPDQYDEKYGKWQLAHLPIIPDEFQRGVIQNNGVQEQYNHIEGLLQSKQTKEVICATDAGREGELIFRLVYARSGCTAPIKRLWISSQTDKAIKAGFDSLKPGVEYDPLYASALSRSEADWLVGINATRAYTIKYSKGAGVMSVGRVQTPVLKMIVDRYRAHSQFVSETFYEVMVKVAHNKETFDAKWVKDTTDRLDTETVAKSIVADLKSNPNGKIANLTEKTKQEQPPLLYDLTELQRDANKKFKYSADQTLKLAQSLYERHKVLTYPRTSSRYLSTDIAPQLKGLASNLSCHEPYAAFVDTIATQNYTIAKRLIDDKKVTDHHAIIPTEKTVPLTQLNTEEKQVYELVIRRFLASFYPNCIKDHTEIISEFGDHRFKSTGTVTKQIGWRALYNNEDENSKKTKKITDPKLPIVTKGDSVLAKSPVVKKGQTKAPPLHTESSILGAMETAGKEIDDEALKQAIKECGLGTPATRAQILERLIAVKYIIRQKNTLVPTPKGEYIIDHIRHPELTSPELTGQWEKKLNDMAQNKYDRSQYMTEIKTFTEQIIDDLKAAPDTGARPDQKVIGPCPIDGCSGSIVETPKAYSCSKWKETNCEAVIWKTMSGKNITEKIAEELLKTGQTKKLKGFKSKSGDSFEAILKLVNGRVQFVYGEPLGSCPLCEEGDVLETPRAFSCSNWKETGCKMVIWKTIAKRDITEELVKKLLQNGKTDILDGFKSKTGNDFSAALELKEGRASFIF
jgi:DNA topoisomerase-3